MVTIGQRLEQRRLTKFLDGSPREVALYLAVRNALRVAPAYWFWRQNEVRGEHLPGELVCSRALNATICWVGDIWSIAGGDYHRETSEHCTAEIVQSALTRIHLEVHNLTLQTRPKAPFAALNLVRLACEAGLSLRPNAASLSAGVFNDIADVALSPKAENALNKDAGILSREKSSRDLRLWHERAAPPEASAVVRNWRSRGGGWEFWADWYEGYLTGQPLGNDLLEQVAVIPSADWDKGDDHVNGIIAAIYAARRVRGLVEDVQAGIAASLAVVPGIGHNLPPSDMSVPATIPALIAEPLAALHAQTDLSKPDKGAIRQAIEAIADFFRRAALWIAGKLDIAADAFAKAAGAGVAATIGLWLNSHAGLVQQLLDAAKKWLSLLP